MTVMSNNVGLCKYNNTHPTIIINVSTSSVTVEDDSASRIFEVSIKRCNISPLLRVSKNSLVSVIHV